MVSHQINDGVIIAIKLHNALPAILGQVRNR